KRLTIVRASGRAQRCSCVEPACRPLRERDPAGCWVDVGAAQLGILDGDQEPLGVDLAGEALGPLPAGRVTPACPPPRPTTALPLAAQAPDAHQLSPPKSPPYPPAPPRHQSP